MKSVTDIKESLVSWTVIYFWGKDIIKASEECLKVVEEAIFEQKIGGQDEYEIEP